jgi:hypothetical protein
MTERPVGTAIDEGDVGELGRLLADDPTLVTALVDGPDIEATSPLTYVGMARFYGYATHDRTGELARVLLEAGADKDDEAKNGSPLICAAPPSTPRSTVIRRASGPRNRDASTQWLTCGRAGQPAPDRREPPVGRDRGR